MGNIVAVSLDDPTTILSANPSLTVGSSWETYYYPSPLYTNTYTLYEAFTYNSYPTVVNNPKPWYIIRPVTGVDIGSGITTSALGITGNTVHSALSVVENTTPGVEVIDWFLRTSFMDYETIGSFTPHGLLTPSFGFTGSSSLLSTDVGTMHIDLDGADDCEISGDNVTITYTMMKNTLLDRTNITAISTDTLDDVSTIIADSDFVMGSEAAFSTFKFYVRNTSATFAIDVVGGVGWTGGPFTVPVQSTMEILASIDYNAGTADFTRISVMDSVV